ncbi:hypothetical protein N8459_02605, partial [Nitrosopumilus sp.]|nr:hypothetical protein [Nitrosopumilus sp.]
KKLCIPSKIYLFISIIVIFISLFNNTTLFSFIYIFITTLFWAWNLNIICKSGYTNISWVLILLPFIYFIFFENEYFTNSTRQKIIADLPNIQKNIQASGLTVTGTGSTAQTVATNNDYTLGKNVKNPAAAKAFELLLLGNGNSNISMVPMPV